MSLAYTHFLQFLNVLLVTLPVAFHLCLPEYSVGLGDSVEPASLMSVPETPVHEYACPILAQHQVRKSVKAGCFLTVFCGNL